MIPVKLTLKNFMSYGAEEAVSFEGLHVACLSGDNGNGKSALLDAVTWALWGKTRASSVGSVGEDDLIRVGTDDVEVRFEFSLNAQDYRVVKKRRRGKSSEWTLAASDGGGGWSSISGGGQREVGRQIVQLLSMEYDTFVNSAYLQQGRADEFTRQTPAKRKAILGEILGLERYDRLEKKARERSSALKEILEGLEGELRLLESEAARLPEHEAALAVAQTALDSAQEKTAAQEKIVGELQERRAGRNELLKRIGDAESAAQRLETDIGEREREAGSVKARLLTLKAFRDQREAILRDYETLQTLRTSREKLEESVADFNKKNAALQQIDNEIERERDGLKYELKCATEKVRDVSKLAVSVTKFDAQIAEIDLLLKDEKQIEAETAAAQTLLGTLLEEFAALKARNGQIKTEIDELKEMLVLLEAATAVCKVCDTDLSGEKKDRVVQKQRKRLENFQLEQKNVTAAGGEMKERVAAAKKEEETFSLRRETIATSRTRREQLIERIKELGDVNASLAKAQKEEAALQLQLEKEDFAAPKRIQKARTAQELERLKKVVEEYDTAGKQLQQLQNAGERYTQLQSAEKDWEREVAESQRLEKVIDTLRTALTAAAEKRDGLRSELKVFANVEEQFEAADRELRLFRSEVGFQQGEVGRFKGYVDGSHRAASEGKLKTEESKKTRQEKWLYDQLAVSFSKKGVQALIIENTLPEIQDEANELLQKMTDNGMQVGFHSVREAKSTRTEIETLDITITDDVGTRPYELFSGGEAFRINFAIRIALSRMLARRSGAKLETLILDEGFGTQDGKGREKLIEVIESIRNDFAMILVITHVEELKDAFQQRIEISKDSTGSHVHMM